MLRIHRLKKIFVLFLLLAGVSVLHAQQTKTMPDSLKKISADSLLIKTDSLKSRPDTSFSKNDSVKISKNSLKSEVKYSARDSIRFEVKSKMVYLYGMAEIFYESIHLQASYIEIDFNKKLISAKGLPDSTGKIVGEPIFNDGGQEFTSGGMTYNYDTKRGIIKDIYTTEGDGFLHGQLVKRQADNSINIRGGFYTTCNHKDPHFAIRFGKAKVIPDDKIITGPAYMEVEKVPMPLGVPFGYFPNKKGQKSGIIIPTYGASSNRGYFLENGGYYIGGKDYYDLSLRGSIFSRGSWAAKVASSYVRKYRYTGSISADYSNNIYSEKGLPDYKVSKDFFIRWSHVQDPKARPTSRFTANVNAGTSSYNQLNSYSANDYLNNTYQSNVSYSKSFGKLFNFTANLRHNQNTQTKIVNLTLPEVTFSMNRYNLFKRKEQVGKRRWYEDISTSYVMNSRNELNTPDSLLFKPETLDRFVNGVKHSIPISTSIKMGYFSFTPTINYNERWYLQSIHKSFQDTLFSATDTLYHQIVTDTIKGFNAIHDANFSANLSTKLYGMLRLKRGPLAALRHVLTPTVGFTLQPAYNKYYKQVQKDTLGNTAYYSMYENFMYGSPARERSGNVTFALNNNLEMKIRTPRDSVNETKKIMLIESFTIQGGYDLARDSLNWNKVYMGGRTKLFKNLDVNYSSLWDPYVVDTSNINYNVFEYKKNNRLLRLSNTEWTLGLNWNLSSKKKDANKKTSFGDPAEISMINANPDNYIDFNNPWRVNLGYNFSHKTFFQTDTTIKTLIQTIRADGDLNITPKWKIGFTAFYDIKAGEFSYVTVDIYRDLHCWEINFHWIPFGMRQSYFFTLAVKSSVLQDLKLTKRRDWYDY